MGELQTLDDVDVDGKRILLRLDLNVPLVHGAPGSPARVADETRIRGTLPTIEELRGRGARLVLVSNVRYEPGETKNDPELVSSLAELADVYVNDAFGTAHRAHASTEGIAHRLPSAAGRLMQREVSTLTEIMKRPKRPLVAVLGGAKVSDKIDVIERFLELADVVCIGGAMSFPFLAAQGHPVGASLCADADVVLARRALAAVAQSRCRLELPGDLVIARQIEPGAQQQGLDGVDIPDGWIGLDIGPRTAAHYAEEIAGAGTVFWNGPMGRFELEPFAAGTRALAEAVASTPGTTVVGGGETVAAMRSFGLQDRVGHLSTGGGATLALLEGHELPGVLALMHTAPVAA
jgi:phosphoglycerate kinase